MTARKSHPNTGSSAKSRPTKAAIEKELNAIPVFTKLSSYEMHESGYEHNQQHLKRRNK